MKLKAVVAAGALALVGASVAFAAPPAGKGKPENAGKPANVGKPATTGVGCKPMVSVILTGKLAADAGSAPTALTVDVSGGNHFAAAWKGNHSVSVALGSSTRVSRQGDHSAADLKSGDKVKIQAKSCKADLADNATPALTAARVTAHTAKAA